MKRLRPNSSCEPCKRLHKSCDGGRPCKRCVSLKRESQCLNPALIGHLGRPKRQKLQNQSPTQILPRPESAPLSLQPQETALSEDTQHAYSNSTLISAEHFYASAIIPFVVDDPLKPYAFIQPLLPDEPAASMNFEDYWKRLRYRCLTISGSFCRMLNFNEVGLLSQF